MVSLKGERTFRSTKIEIPRIIRSIYFKCLKSAFFGLSCEYFLSPRNRKKVKQVKNAEPKLTGKALTSYSCFIII